MIDFHPLRLEDKDWIVPLIRTSGFRGSEYCFSNNYAWRSSYHVEAAKWEDFYVARAGLKVPSYLYPAGSGDLCSALEALYQDAQERNIPFRLHGATEEGKNQLENIFQESRILQSLLNSHAFIQDRDSADYLYEAEKLRTLAGKKLHSKRNHINRFIQNNPEWEFEGITLQNLKSCREMCDLWYAQQDPTVKVGLELEEQAIHCFFEHYDALGLQGGLLKAGGRIIAITMGEPLNADTFVIHIEKAFGEIQGAYPMINREFAARCTLGYTFINREEDMGLEGLRKAKLSYYPILLEKYRFLPKEEL